MKQEATLREVQLFELEMLKRIAEVCEKYGLRYYLYCGTLLGCIRHGGFIPWDDDIDLAMPLKDYRRFVKVAQSELGADYLVINRKTAKHCNFLWTKVSASGTTYMQEKEAHLMVHHGVSIDIYPFVGAAKGARMQRLQEKMIETSQVFFNAERNKALDLYHDGIAREMVNRLPLGLRRGLGNLLFALACIDPDKCENAGTIDAAKYSGKYRWKDWEKVETHAFEGVSFVIPSNYDLFLRTMYGDYMQLPPVEKRIGHVGDPQLGKRYVYLDRDCEEVRKEILAGIKP